MLSFANVHNGAGAPMEFSISYAIYSLRKLASPELLFNTKLLSP